MKESSTKEDITQEETQTNVSKNDENANPNPNNGGLIVGIAVILSILGIVDCRDFISKIILSSMYIIDFILAIIITVLWRRNFIYFTDNILMSWLSTFACSFIVSFLLTLVFTSPILWCVEIFFDYWYVVAGIVFFIGYKLDDSEDKSTNLDESHKE